MSTAGPMATSLASIEKYMESLPEAEPWELDNLVTPMPWRKELCNIQPNSRKLKIGYILDDHVVKPQPPITRAVQLVVDALKNAGHEVFEWDSSSHKLGYDLWLKAILSDGGAGCKRLCDMSGEPLIEGMLVGHESNLLTTEQEHQLMHDIDAYKTEYLRRWVDMGVDAIIMPVMPWVGYKPGTWVKSHQYVGYTSLANLLDWPALSIPVTTASKKEDGILSPGWITYTPTNIADEFNKSQCELP
jgi:amidase